MLNQPHLQTKSTYNEFRKIADQTISQIKTRPEIIGVLITGGLSRSFTDEFSDIDIEVFLHKADFYKWQQNCPIRLNDTISGYPNSQVEVELFCYEDEIKRTWSIENRWDKQYAIISYSKDSLVEELIRNKVRFNSGELTSLIEKSHRYAFWLGNIVTESWTKRGDVASAQACLNFGVEHLIDYLYLINNEFIPHRKWKFSFVTQLKKLPKNFSKKITHFFQSADINEKRDIFRELLKESETL